jgi:hypothetical protein
MEPVVVYRTFSSADAQLIRSYLNGAGIPAEVTGELASLSMEGYSVATGGIRVLVPGEFEQEAREVLAAKAAPEEPGSV